MGYRSTAKQRLWLTCLGYDVPDSAEGEMAREMFEHAGSSRRYQEPVTSRQQTLARKLDIDLRGLQTCSDAAGKLYHTLLLQAWVYSVWRSATGDVAGSYAQLGLPAATAISVAREMETAGQFEAIERFATTDGREADVFYRMSKSAQSSEPYRFVVERLQPPSATTRPLSRPTKRGSRGGGTRTISRKSQSSRAQRGGCLVLLFLVSSAGAALAAASTWPQP